ncbi:LexA family transcriptional regulator [Kingella negevensis]|uniref:LexA family transcriptional regulator n=1 Tax=Kingella negevensis TaxID=1522312 RepID=UPI00050A3131|nr:LexA family transcriptional regulator [Kingella negevensis]MDK4688522.1 LexA family transcriptional regulator [Kingella negevensis]
MTLQERLEFLMKEYDLRTQQDLASFAGVSKGLVNQWFKGDTGLGKKPLLAFEKKTNFSTRWLADGSGEKYRNAPIIHALNNSGSQNNVVGAQINNHYAPNTPSATAPSSLHTITMPDNSFMPLIPQGSQLWLDEQGDWLDGKIYWIEYADWRGFRRCFRQPENKIDLLADNASFRNFENIDRDKVSILARVVSWKVEDK